MKRLFLTLSIIALLSSFKVYAQPSISAARDSSLGTTITITGIVTNGGELGGIRYIEDGSAGIAAYSTSLSAVNRGDSITVTGVLKDYNYLLEIDPVSSHTVHSSGAVLPAPQLITPDQLSEPYEAELVQIDDVVFAGGGGTFSSNTSYNFTSNGQSSSIFVRSSHPLIGTIIPSSEVSIIGICSQYSYVSPTEGYQLLCRDGNDIISNSTIAITSPISVDNITTSGFDLSWTTDSVGSSEIFYGNTTALELGALSGTGGTTIHSVSISGASAAELFYVQAFSVSGTDTAFSLVKPFITQSNSSGDIKVYFTTDVDNSVSTGVDAIHLIQAMDDTLIAYLNRAKYSIDIAIYNFSNQNVSNISAVLNAIHNAGNVDIRVIYDGGSSNFGIQTLDAGIAKIASPSGGIYGIMHNKFVVIDGKSADPNDPLIWTGSTNWTEGNLNSDANNTIIIQDQSLATAYTLEFEEMFGSDSLTPNPTNAKFGPDKTDNTPHKFIIGGKNIESYFSPSDDANKVILNTIESANTDMQISTMLITRSDIAYKIEDAVNAGVTSHVLVNSEGECSASVFALLTTELGSNFLTDNIVAGTMHNKMMIVDHGNTASDPTLLTGCHNWSNAANNKNDENTLVIHDATIANIYYQHFVARYSQNGGIIGMQEQKHINNDIIVYPNPSNGIVNIEYLSNEDYKIEIYDLCGKLVFDKKTNGEYITKVDLSAHTEGMYIIKINSKSKSLQEKIIIQ